MPRPAPPSRAGLPISARLRDARLAADLSQSQVGERLGVGKGTYANYEHGRRNPSGAWLARFERAVGLEPGSITPQTRRIRLVVAGTDLETADDDSARLLDGLEAARPVAWPALSRLIRRATKAGITVEVLPPAWPGQTRGPEGRKIGAG